MTQEQTAVPASRTFGIHPGEASGPCEYLTLVFSPLSVPLRSRWRNNGLSADFLGDYVITFLPRGGDSAPQEAQQNEIRHAVSFVANELLENAMKYHERRENKPIRMHLQLTGDSITISATNGVGSGQAQTYTTFVERVLSEDPVAMLMSQLEAASVAGSDASGLGLLTMITDYGVELGWQFDVNAEQADMITVTTSATLPLKDLPGVLA